MKVLLLIALIVRIDAEKSIVIDDLAQRAIASLRGIRRANTTSEAEGQREPLRVKLEAAVGLPRIVDAGSVTAFLYLPDRISTPTPGIVVARPHLDPKSADLLILASSLARLGFIVIEVDLRDCETRFDLMPAGIPPEGLIQHRIRAGLAYLLSRRDVDPQRVGLIGSGLAVTLGAALNSKFAAVLVTDGGPDLEKEIEGNKELHGGDIPDPCYFIPGLVHFAATQELFAMIAPRPLFVTNASQNVIGYAANLYLAFDASDRLGQGDEGADVDCRYAAYRWMTRWLQGRTDLESFSEVAPAFAPMEVSLPGVVPMTNARSQLPIRPSLPALLGEALPAGTMAFRLKKATQQSTHLTTQKGFDLPATAFRPGQDGQTPECGTMIAISDAGKDALGDDEVVQEALRRGWLVWTVDPRGIGGFGVEAQGFVFFASVLLGENFVWRQALDISRIIEGVGSLHRNLPVGLYARGKTAGVIAAYVAAQTASDHPAWIALRDSISSFTEARDLSPYLTPIGSLGAFDIQDLIAGERPRVLVVTRIEDFIRSDW